jgi:LPS O-antigen subunit length determinant protein (WzzB/FepE family)
MQHPPFDNPDHSDKGEIDFSNLIYAFWQGKWLIILTTLVTIFVGGYYAFVVVRGGRGISDHLLR